MSATFYEYARCSTCRKARKWLEEHQVSFKAVPLVDKPPSESELKRFWKDSGLELRKFFNTSGEVYREKKLSEKLGAMSEAEMLKLLAANGKLIKRPLLVKDGAVLVGFDEKAYEKLFRN